MLAAEEALKWIQTETGEVANQKDLRQKVVYNRNAVFIPGEPKRMLKEWQQKKQAKHFIQCRSYSIDPKQVVKETEMSKALKKNIS